MNRRSSPQRRFRLAIGVLISGLVLSGSTAFPLLTEMQALERVLGAGSDEPLLLVQWVATVRLGLEQTYAQFPWIAYGTDWLGYAHLVIALFFIGPFIDPPSARANIVAGIVASIGIFPLALICGGIRGVPMASRLIDCSFGLAGLLPLLYCHRLLPRISEERSAN